VSELREVIGALQSEVEFEAAVSELGAAGIDRSRISFLAQEAIAASCAGAVGCDIKRLPRIEIGLSDDRQQVRTLATSLAAMCRPSPRSCRRGLHTSWHLSRRRGGRRSGIALRGGDRGLHRTDSREAISQDAYAHRVPPARGTRGPETSTED
jgi:hypothetical protein